MAGFSKLKLSSIRGSSIAVLVVMSAAGCAGAGTSPSATAAPAPTQAPSQAVLATPVLGTFHLEKTCEGTECTVTKSTLSAIPVGTKISYSGPGMDALTATVVVQGGQATGKCNIANMPGTCEFSVGTGTLAKFPAKVVVTQAGPIWNWDGDLRT